MNKLLSIGFFVSFFLSLFPSVAIASTMTNDNYQVEKQSIEIQPYQKEQPKQDIPVEKPLVSGENFTVDSNNKETFSFSISQTQINFGTLQATNPVLRELTLSLTGSHGYQLVAAEDHPLQNEDQTIIPDTTCDNGSCSEGTAAPWDDTLTYGFGYHLDTMEADTYKQFANLTHKEPFQTMISGGQSQKSEAKLTYRVNISGTQDKGGYENTIFYIATPDF